MWDHLPCIGSGFATTDRGEDRHGFADFFERCRLRHPLNGIDDPLLI